MPSEEKKVRMNLLVSRKTKKSAEEIMSDTSLESYTEVVKHGIGILHEISQLRKSAEVEFVIRNKETGEEKVIWFLW